MLGRGRRAPTDVDEALRDALLAVLDRDLEEAERLLSEAVQLDSSRIEPYQALARLYRMRGEIGRAIRVHQNLLLRKDLDEAQQTQALVDLAADFRRGGFLQRAIAAYEDVLSREPKHEGALEAMVALAADVRDYDRAIDASRRLAKRVGRKGGDFAREGALRVEQARALAAKGRSDEARKALRKALRKEPDAVEGWLTLGELEAQAGRDTDAIAAWKRVPGIDRRRGRAVYPLLERAYADLNQRDAFVAWLREQLDARPDDGSARLALARALASSGKVDVALDELHAASHGDPDNLELHLGIGRILLSEGRDAEAAKAHGELLDVLERRGLLRRTESLR